VLLESRLSAEKCALDQSDAKSVEGVRFDI
jgi:hypothetical protein